jgi:photosystem II stability/assembly factor-like uncharacterized protein
MGADDVRLYEWYYYVLFPAGGGMNIQMVISITGLCVMIFLAGCGDSRMSKGWNCIGTSSIALEDRSAGEPGIGVAGFIDDDTGIAVGSHVCVMTTLNGGRSWEQAQYPLGFADLDGLEILDRKHAWTTGGFGIRVTEDGGKTWTEIPHYGGIERPGHYISFSDTKTGWYSVGSLWGLASPLMATDDGGKTWRMVSVPDDAKEQIMAIHLLKKNIGYILLRRGVILKTENSGKNWSSITLPLNGRGRIESNPGAPIDAVRFIDELRGIVVMHFEKPRAYAIFETNDGGKSWKEFSLPANTDMRYGNVFLSRDARYLTVSDLFSGKIYLFRRD